MNNLQMTNNGFKGEEGMLFFLGYLICSTFVNFYLCTCTGYKYKAASSAELSFTCNRCLVG
jgi:hypothetical protein